MRTLGAVRKDELCHVLSWGSMTWVAGLSSTCAGDVWCVWAPCAQTRGPVASCPRGSLYASTGCPRAHVRILCAPSEVTGPPCLPGLLCGLRGQQDTFRQRPFIVPRKAGATVCARAEHALQLSPPYTVPTLRLPPACPLQPPGGTTLPLRGHQKPLRPSRPCGRKWPSAALASRWRAARAPMSAGSAPPPSRALPPVSPT